MSSKKKDFKVYQFDPMVYPRFLWVAKGGDCSDVKKWFLNHNGQELDWLDDDKMGGITISVFSKFSQCYGELIWFPDIRLVKANWITHESVHGTLDLFDQLGLRVDYRNQEPVAYLAGWFAECIEFVKMGKAEELKLK